ncbi:hypothetical protein Tco_1373889 [Tanacetum coccineum]
MVSIPMTFPSANSTEYLVSTVDGMMFLTGVRLLSTRFHVLAIIASIALTSGPSEVSSVQESHNLCDSNSQKVGFGVLAKGVGFLYVKAEENPLGYDAYECGYT